MKLAFFLCLLCGFSQTLTAKQKLIFGGGDWCPFACDPKTAAGKYGYTGEILKEIFTAAGYEVVIEILPYARNIELTRKGQNTGIIAVYKSEVPDFIFPKSHLGITSSYFYIRSDSTWKYKDESSLKSMRMGVINAYDYIYEPLKKLIAKGGPNIFTVSGNDPSARLIGLLIKGRIDLITDDGPVIDYNAARLGLAHKIKKDPYQLSKVALYPAFSPAIKDAAKLLQIYEKGRAKMIKNGRIEAILQGYGIKDKLDDSIR